MGLVHSEDEWTSDSMDPINFIVWSKFVFKSKDFWETQLKNVDEEFHAKEEGRPTDLLEPEEDIINADQEILDKFDKRFGKTLPMDCVNVILIMDKSDLEKKRQVQFEGGQNS